MRFPRVLGGLVAAFLWLCVDSGSCDPVYSIQVSASGTEEGAQAHYDELIEDIYPVHLFSTTHVETNFPHRVAIGSFDYFAEAWVYRTRLDSERFEGAYIIELPENLAGNERQRGLSSMSLPIERVFDLEGMVPELAPSEASEIEGDNLKSSAMKGGAVSEEDVENIRRGIGISQLQVVSESVREKSVTSLSREELLEVGVHDRNPRGVPALERFIAENPEDPEVNHARMRLARRLMGRGDFVGVNSLLEAVAGDGSAAEVSMARQLQAYSHMHEKGSSQSVEQWRELANDRTHPRSLRLEAMRNAAGAAHSARWFPTAWLAFRDIEGVSDEAQATSEARMQLVGLALELANRDIGSMEEVERLAQSLKDLPDVTKEAMARSELMRLESILFRNDYERVLEEADAFLEEYSEYRKEYACVTVLKGAAMVMLRDFPDAEAILLDATEMELGGRDLFANTDQRATALSWLAYSRLLQGDVQGRIEFLQALEESYSHTLDWERAKAFHGYEQLKERVGGSEQSALTE
ncbi:MAG: SPOR domain-containing protein [Candidatus Sumerlaeia bacterium]|nr:SPOR domain-containing protein [Candidatus Sumerlaeia bacterium]